MLIYRVCDVFCYDEITIGLFTDKVEALKVAINYEAPDGTVYIQTWDGTFHLTDDDVRIARDGYDS